MSFRIPKATAKLIVFKAYLASDHVTEATGKTIAITISKNGGAFGNPNAGATTATEISSGWYKVTLDTTDTGTEGRLAIRGAVATIDDVGVLYEEVKATNGGFTALPDAAAEASGGLYTRGSGAGQINQNANGQVDTRTVSMSADVVTAAAVAADAVTEIQSGLATAANLATVAGYIDTEVAAILAKVTNLPSDPADASDIAASFSSIAATLATIAAYIDTEVAAIKDKTDRLTFTKAAELDVNIHSVNGVTVNGTGVSGNEWGP